jgi:hypothetical protein
MIIDPELDQWSELFRSEQIASAEIAARAKKAVYRFRLWIYAEVAVTVCMGGGATFWALKAHQTSISLLVAWVWISLAAAWTFRLINDWNDFTGVAVAAGSYLTILLRRLRSNVRAAEFGGVLFFVQLAVTSTWVFREINSHSPVSLQAYLALPANIIFAIGTVVFCVWLVLYRRKLHTEIAQLQKLQAGFDDPSPAPFPERAAALFRRRLKKKRRAH